MKGRFAAVGTCLPTGSALVAAAPLANPAAAQNPINTGADAHAQAEQAQNPIADLIGVPSQKTTNFNFGPRERTTRED